MFFSKIKRASLFALFFLCSQFAIAQLTIHVNSIPANTPAGDDIYIAGNFNNWNPGDNNYKLTDNGNGTYQIIFTPSIGQAEFKFTRGAWASVEGTTSGTFIPNRVVNYSGGQQSENLTIAGWEGNNGGGSTLADNAYILSDDFEIPQLNRTRRIWIYLPPDYETTDHTYPVMYMQDGQNLFDISTSFSGEWEVDESLNDLFENGDKGIIIVGIDNGGAHRIDEYSPWVNAQYGGGEGAAYVDFIIQNLKPTIDNNFRTKPDRLNTGIMGSSLGGLISFYAAIEHQDVFGKAGVFSPSFWFSNEVFTHVTTTGKQQDMKIYLMGGEQESSSLIQELQTMRTTLLNAGFGESEIELLTHVDGQHSEWYWKREFPDAYLWLFNDVINAVNKASSTKGIKISPNPVEDTLYIQASFVLEGGIANIYSLDGKLLFAYKVSLDGSIGVQNLKNGIYILEILKGGERVFAGEFLKERR